MIVNAQFPLQFNMKMIPTSHDGLSMLAKLRTAIRRLFEVRCGVCNRTQRFYEGCAVGNCRDTCCDWTCCAL